jgi:hypothetical protein
MWSFVGDIVVTMADDTDRLPMTGVENRVAGSERAWTTQLTGQQT